MKKSEVLAWLVEMNINVQTISVAVPVDDDGKPFEGEVTEHEGNCDPWYGTCDISDELGNTYLCTALDNDGNLVKFEVGERLITGHLGKIAGCF